MFNFLFMQPYKVAVFELPDLFGRDPLVVDTVGGITDSGYPFETGIAHPSYNDGAWVIVEQYSTEEEAQAGHEKWVKIMTANELPAQLEDVSTSEVAQLAEAVGGKEFRTKCYTIDITPDEPKQLPS